MSSGNNLMNKLVCQHDISRNDTNCTIITWEKGDIETGDCNVVYNVYKDQDSNINLQNTEDTFKYYTCNNSQLFESVNVTIGASVYDNGFPFNDTQQVTCDIVTPPPPTTTTTTMFKVSSFGKHISILAL